MTPDLFCYLHGLGVLLVACVAYLVRRGNFRKYPSDWFVGWVAFGVCVASHAASGVAYALAFSSNITSLRSEALYVAYAAACVGWFVGNMLGDWIWWRYRKEINGDPDAG